MVDHLSKRDVVTPEGILYDEEFDDFYKVSKGSLKAF